MKFFMMVKMIFFTRLIFRGLKFPVDFFLAFYWPPQKIFCWMCRVFQFVCGPKVSRKLIRCILAEENFCGRKILNVSLRSICPKLFFRRALCIAEILRLFEICTNSNFPWKEYVEINVTSEFRSIFRRSFFRWDRLLFLFSHIWLFQRFACKRTESDFLRPTIIFMPPVTITS